MYLFAWAIFGDSAMQTNTFIWLNYLYFFNEIGRYKKKSQKKKKKILTDHFGNLIYSCPFFPQLGWKMEKKEERQ